MAKQFKNARRKIIRTTPADPMRPLRHSRYDRSLIEKMREQSERPREIETAPDRLSASIEDLLRSRKAGYQK